MGHAIDPTAHHRTGSPHQWPHRDLILFGGGFFLLWKSTREIFDAMEGGGEQLHEAKARAFVLILIQIAIIDIVFSLDSVITAVGLVQQVPIMIVAIMLAVLLMMFAARPIGEFVDRHPSLKMLALSFLILESFTLMAEGFSVVIPKPYIHTAMGFSLAVEALNIRMRTKAATSSGGPKSRWDTKHYCIHVHYYNSACLFLVIN